MKVHFTLVDEKMDKSFKLQVAYITVKKIYHGAHFGKIVSEMWPCTLLLCRMIQTETAYE